MKPMGLTESSRDIIALTTPETLNVSKIWKEWLPAYIPAHVYEALNGDEFAKFRIELLFATVARIPRAVQFVVIALQNYFRTTGASSMSEATDPKALESFYSESYNELDRKYGRMRNTIMSTKHARAIIFEEAVKLDAEIAEMIKNSLLTNSLEPIDEETTLIPKTSALSMKIYSKHKNEQYWKSIRHTIEELERLFLDKPNRVKLGDFLEISVRGLISARLFVLMQLARDDSSLAPLHVGIHKLLLLHDIVDTVEGASDELESRLESKFVIPRRVRTLQDIPLSNSYSGVKKFLSSANVAPSVEGRILQLRPVPDSECFDYGVTLSLEASGKPFAIFMEAKSGRQYPSEAVCTSITSEAGLSGSGSVGANASQGGFGFPDLPNGGKHARHLLENITDIAKTCDLTKIAKGSMLEALREGNFLYIYVNTSKSAPSFAVGDHVMQLGEADSKHLLSFLLDSYRLVRTASTPAQDLDAKERRRGG